MAGETPSQTVGPFLSIVLPWADGPLADPAGVRVHGYVRDGAGEPVPDALVETWQSAPDAYARCPTDETGHWEVTVPPARFIATHVFARGLLRHLTTRIYLQAPADDDPLLAAVPAARRGTLRARPDGAGYRFDIRLQGEGETVFFDV